jgi:signal transduction histidine kinase/DNA-binding NarL/FixJ family response regulator
MKFEKTSKIANYFLLLALVTVGIVGGMAYVTAKQSLEKAAFEKLNVAANLKEEEIDRWFEDLQQDFLLTVEMPDIKANLALMLSSTDREKTQQAYASIAQHFTKFVQIKPKFDEISIIDRDRQVIFSTNRHRQNRQQLFQQITYVKPGQQANFTPLFYLDPITKKPAMTLAQAIVDRHGVEQGKVLVQVNLNRIDRIVGETSGLGTSGQTYLVGSLVGKKKHILANSATKNEFIGHQLDFDIDRASGYELYRNSEQIPVLGVYSWLKRRQLGLLVEMSQDEAFLPARQLASAIISIGSLCVLGLLVGVNWLSKQLSHSRQQLEDYSHQLEITAQKAETANHAKSLFLANMSHELRTPLNAILGFSQLMERDSNATEQQKEFLGIINRSGEHLLNLINDVLEMSKIEAGKTTLNLESFDLLLLLTTIQEMFQMRAVAKQLNFRAIWSEDLPRYIIGDRHKLRQVLMNLLSNAIKFTHMGEVTLKVWSKPQSSKQAKICFEVSDTGQGIAPQELEKLFEPFVQTSSGIISEGGTGLGLAISRQFVGLMGGEIRVHSMLDLGSTFYFNIETLLGESSLSNSNLHKPKIQKIATNQPQYRILVVDDKTANRRLLLEILQAVGFTPRSATNGREAISIWKLWQPDLIWMDMRMPLMDGYRATKYIKSQENGTKTKIIALTALAFEEQREKIFNAGCDDFLSKPFREERIFEMMAQHLGVKYVYESDKLAVVSGATFGKSRLGKDLSYLSPEWLNELHQAAIAVDGEKIEQLIEDLAPRHDLLARSLLDITRRYDFDTIIELTKIDRHNLTKVHNI